MGPVPSGDENKDLPERVLLHSPASKNYYKKYLAKWPQRILKILRVGDGQNKT